MNWKAVSWAIFFIVASLFVGDIATTYYGVCVTHQLVEQNGISTYGGYALSFPLYSILMDGAVLAVFYWWFVRNPVKHKLVIAGTVIILLFGFVVYNNVGEFLYPLPATDEIHSSLLPFVPIQTNMSSFDSHRFCEGPWNWSSWRLPKEGEQVMG